MSLEYKQIAADLAPRLDKALNNFLAGGTDTALRQFLWDNKVGILRILQSYGELENKSS